MEYDGVNCPRDRDSQTSNGNHTVQLLKFPISVIQWTKQQQQLKKRKHLTQKIITKRQLFYTTRNSKLTLFGQLGHWTFLFPCQNLLGWSILSRRTRRTTGRLKMCVCSRELNQLKEKNIANKGSLMGLEHRYNMNNYFLLPNESAIYLLYDKKGKNNMLE